MSPRLALQGISKRFGAVLANDAIDLLVEPGQVHALLGENGAGKSTLMKIVYGVLQPDAGAMQWEGRPAAIRSPHAARELGIGMVFQHFSLFEAMTVQENVALGLEERLRPRALAARIAEVAAAYGLPLAADRYVHELSVGERQRIEIVRCLLQNPRLVIMDEPTSVLTPQEAERLFLTLRRLADEGVSVLYISHKLDEIRRLCDRATILRQGRVVACVDPARETARSLAERMVGTRLDPPVRTARTAPKAARLVVDGLDLAPLEPHGVTLRAVRLAVRGGEILGIAGVAGNGQAELLAALAGERRVPAAVIRLDDRPIGRLGPAGRRVLGLSYIPENRDGHAAVGLLPLSDNALLTGAARRRLARFGLIRSHAVGRFAHAIVERFDVRTSGIAQAAASLSGGNLQKFVVGREILQAPGVLIAAQPTWGVDAAAAAAIHEALLGLADAGCALLVISQDLDELLTLTDRLAVLHAGRLSEPQPTRDCDVGGIGLLMGGLHDDDGIARAA